MRAKSERSIYDALRVVRDVVKESKIVAGDGAPEEEVARARAFPSDLSFTSKMVRGVGPPPKFTGKKAY